MSLDKIISIFFGTKHERDVKKMRPYVKKINVLEDKTKSLSDSDLKNKTTEFKERFQKGETLDELLPEAFAVVRETAIRVLGMRHFDVQLMGGLVLHQGRIAEMKTGEGKTLVATLPVYLNALSGLGVHVVTVNDYLAKRDAQWMSPVYKFLGLSVGIIQHNLNPEERQKAYAADITYGTNNEFGFDYLRDNMVEHQSLKVQRDLNYCIVDEVDSILIDEARTPLIISGSVEDSTKKYFQINKLIPNLKEEVDYEVNEKDRNALLTEEGVRHIEKILKIDNLYDNRHIDTLHHINQALKAHTLFKREIDYIVTDGQVVIVDEFTGRLMEGRRYSDGLHQAIEAKENVTIARESQTLASVTFQNFFRMYNKLSGMTGTADTEAIEFKKIYNLDVAVIPTNAPLIRKDYADKIYRTEREKLEAIATEIVDLSSKGQPILVGTISIEKSEKLAALLKAKGIIHNVLNAKYHQHEATIVAEAGSPGAVTIATNMAGRGTDIVLGGKKVFMELLEEHQAVHEEDLWNNFKNNILKLDFSSAEILAGEMKGQDKHKAVDIVKKGAEWLGKHQQVKEAGGLHILGTERHESRRIDNQLRGRSGRQGDPGSSRFYLSLEDDLMRLFGSDRIGNVMQRLGMEEGQEIESKMVSKAIASAQKRVEGRNFEIRKHLLEYDDVMNTQREFVYKERNQILSGEDLSEKITTYVEEVLESEIEGFATARYHEDWNLNGLRQWLKGAFRLDFSSDDLDGSKFSLKELKSFITQKLLEAYHQKESNLGSKDMRILERMISLQIIDNKWRQHLLSMDQLRDGIWTLGYGEKNPLVEYKIEGFHLFKVMLHSIKRDILEYLMKVQIEKVVEEPPEVKKNDFSPQGDEFHPEVGQFGRGGIPLGMAEAKVSSPQKGKKEAKEDKPVTGGVKRKKSRRGRK
jgi:preprotein translocase subunit SecA